MRKGGKCLKNSEIIEYIIRPTDLNAPCLVSKGISALAIRSVLPGGSDAKANEY